MVKSNIETFLRIKPSDNYITHMTNSEESDNEPSNEIHYETKSNNTVLEIKVPEEMRKGYVNNLKRNYEFKFNGIFNRTATQEEIFDNIGQKVIKNSLQGYNNTVFCYGQTGSGKTFTMCGSKFWKDRGLIPRIIIELFKQIKNSKNYSYEIFISYLEIYNENAFDLLDKHHSEMDIDSWRKIIVYEDNNGNIMLKNLSMIKVENEQQALELLMTGNYIRHVSSTPNNLASSRSHAVFTCILEGRELNTEVMRVSKINLVDLAGSERMKSTLYDSNTVNETKYINLSLSFLEQVIIALNEKTKKNRSHIPYRNSLMTTILKDSLGGNCKTILVANVSSEIDSLEETFSTMRFAARCAKVENEITVNEHMDLNVLVSKLNSENAELRKQLMKMSNTQCPDKFLEVKENELSPYEKDECKIIISEYLNNTSKNKKIETKNANQLFFIIDFLIEYINNKERVQKEKIGYLLQENKDMIEFLHDHRSKIQEFENNLKTQPDLYELFNNLNINNLDIFLHNMNVSRFSTIRSSEIEETYRTKQIEDKISIVNNTKEEEIKINPSLDVDRTGSTIYVKSFKKKNMQSSNSHKNLIYK